MSFVWLLAILLAASQAEIDPMVQYTADIDEAERLGRAIFEKDRLAWIATDVLLSLGAATSIAGALLLFSPYREGEALPRWSLLCGAERCVARWTIDF